MYRILIADDEGIMRESIRQTIQAGFGSECELATAKSGREVIEQCRTFHPDIAFVDIQMPGLSGMQAIEEVQKTDSSILFIIITAYDRFSYAQEAINLGVREFITKPVGKKKITEVCASAMREVDRRRKQRSDDLRIREKLEIVIPMIESAFIHNILQEDKSGNGRDYLQMLDIPQENGFVITLEFGERDETGGLTNAVGSNVRANQRYPAMRETIAGFLHCVVGPIMGSRVAIYVPFEGRSLGYEQRVEIIMRVRSLLHRLEEDEELSFRAGIGGIYPVEEGLVSYRESIRSLRQGSGHVVHVNDLNAAGEVSDIDLRELEERYLMAGMKASVPLASQAAEEILLRLEDAAEEDRKMKLLELLLRLELKAGEAGTLGGDFRRGGNYLRELNGAADEAALREWFLWRTRFLCQEIGESGRRDGEGLVDRVISYIKEHFAEDLSLDDVSRIINVSPYYASRLFKQETGENFTEFLARTRIQKAKEYLSNPAYSIKEVCVMCGYSDPNYFSRTFRKYEGISPSDYRQG